jgi:hypothetical protein
MKYEKPQIVRLPNAVTSVSANPLLKHPAPPDGPQGSISAAAAYSSDE